jgi:SOS-response transcriptional repressor LexA
MDIFRTKELGVSVQGNQLRQKLLAFIAAYQAQSRVAPTLAEMRAALAVSSNSVLVYHLSILEAQGYIRRNFHQPRGIEIIGEIPHAEGMTIPAIQRQYGSADAPVANPVIGLPYKIEPRNRAKYRNKKKKG